MILPSLITTLKLTPSRVPSTRVVRPTVVTFDAGSVATSEMSFMILSVLQPGGWPVFSHRLLLLFMLHYRPSEVMIPPGKLHRGVLAEGAGLPWGCFGRSENRNSRNG